MSKIVVKEVKSWFVRRPFLLILGGIILIVIVSSLLFGLPKKVKEGEVHKSGGLVSESLYFNEGDMEGKIIKNKLTQTATIDINSYINDSIEYVDFLGERITGAPFLINYFCVLFATAFFDETALQELQKEGNITTEGDEQISLEGYTVKSASTSFYDKETNEKIATCVSTGSEWDDIKFETYRDYSNVGSIFDAEIGKQLDSSSEPGPSSGIEEPTAESSGETTQLEVLQLDCIYNGYGEILGHEANYLGRVKNNGNILARFVQVYVDFFDGKGKLVGTDSTFVSGTDIPSGEIRSFEGHAIELLSSFESCEGRATASSY